MSGELPTGRARHFSIGELHKCVDRQSGGFGDGGANHLNQAGAVLAGSGARNEEQNQAFPPDRRIDMSNGGDLRPRVARGPPRNFLDIFRRLAAAVRDDHVLGASDRHQQPFVGHETEVARVEPFAPDGGGGDLGIADIAVRDVGTRYVDTTDMHRRKIAVLVVAYRYRAGRYRQAGVHQIHDVGVTVRGRNGSPSGKKGFALDA